ncbi:hypothetical protein [Palaeococcus ferrophilus]|uniref:hypothetical protein n=1 Tax=Palaeococcus ferrophilus TaxID=83868 RepID=UPI0012F9DDAE|nr:hypothetical protein [Palaeococcus ferrophilus]
MPMEVPPPDIEKRGRGIDDYLSEGLDTIISNPRLIIPFVPGVLASFLYGLYILKVLLQGGSLLNPSPDALAFFTTRQFWVMTAAVASLVIVSTLSGMISVANFVMSGELDLWIGLKKLPRTLLTYAVLVAVLTLFYLPLGAFKNVVIILGLVLIATVLFIPPLFLAPALLLEKSFPLPELLAVYRESFGKSLVLGILYTLATSAASSLIPVVGSFLNYLVLVPMFTASYSLLYRDLKKEKSALAL